MGHGKARGVEFGWTAQVVQEQRKQAALIARIEAQIERRETAGLDTSDLRAMLADLKA